MAEFIVDPRIEASSVLIGDLKLCQVRLQNDARFPWLVLLPRQAGLTELIQLEGEDEARLFWDVRVAQGALATACATVLTRPYDKFNVANLGNVVPQLHIHVIARHAGDDAWPGPVWGHGTSVAYADDVLDALKTRLSQTLSRAMG